MTTLLRMGVTSAAHVARGETGTNSRRGETNALSITEQVRLVRLRSTGGRDLARGRAGSKMGRCFGRSPGEAAAGCGLSGSTIALWR